MSDPVRQLAEILGLHVRTVQRYRDAGMPDRRGREPFKSWAGRVEDWRRETRKKSGPKLTNDQEALATRSATWDGELKRARALRAQLDLAVAQGDFHSVEDCERETVGRIMEVRNALLGWPRKLARRLANQSADFIEEQLQAEARDVLESFARGETKTGNGETKTGNGEP